MNVISMSFRIGILQLLRSAGDRCENCSACYESADASSLLATSQHINNRTPHIALRARVPDGLTVACGGAIASHHIAGAL
jgi:hypothetical protein